MHSPSELLELEQTAMQLRQSEELNRRIMEAMPGGIVHVSSAGSILTANAEALRILGLSYDEITHKYTVDFDTETIWEDGTHCRNEDYPVTRAIVTGQPQPPCTIGTRRPDGQVSWAVFTAVPVIDSETSQTTGAVVTFLDITARKQAEQELRELETKFQHAQKLDSLGILAGGIAHDYNNLLAVILGNAGLARLALPADSAAQPYLKSIEQAAQRAADLAGQMLAYSGKGKFVTRHVDLSRLVADLGELLHVAISKKVTLSYALTPDLPPVVADPTQLQQVVMNLITNASDAIGDAQGNIVLRTGMTFLDRAELKAMYVDEGLPDGDYVFLEVHDDGRGMTPEIVRRVFDPFFTTKSTGRGLGLSAVLGIIRGHRGSIKVATAPGRGTTFTVYLPPANAVAVAADKLSSLRPAEGVSGSPKVLVVDDEPAVRETAMRILTEHGFDAVGADGGLAALRIAKIDPTVCAVLLDLTMPDMSGDEVLSELRRLRADLPVLLCSGYSEQEMAHRAGEDARVEFLQKPYSYRSLVTRLRKLTGK